MSQGCHRRTAAVVVAIVCLLPAVAVGVADQPGVTDRVATAGSGPPLAEEPAGTRTVQEAVFEATIVEAPEEVVAGDPLAVTVEVENTGNVTDTQTVDFSLRQDEQAVFSDARELTLEPGERQQVTFEYQTAGGDAPELRALIEPSGEPASTTIQVVEPGVEASFTPNPVTATGETTLGISADRGAPVLVTVSDADGSTTYVETQVDLDEENRGSLTLRPTDDLAGPGEYEAVVTQQETEATTRATLTVEQQAALDVEITEVDEQVSAGEVVGVTAAVTNTGDRETTAPVRFEVVSDGEVVRRTRQNVTVAGGETETVGFEYQTQEGDAPGITVRVGVDDAVATETVEVTTASPAFGVDLTAVPDQVTEGETLPVTALVTNQGETEATQSVGFDVFADGEVVFTDSESVTLAPGEERQVVFSYQTRSGDAPSLEVRVRSENESASRSVAVVDGRAAFDVELRDVPEAVDLGDDIDVTASVVNLGSAEATQNVTFTVLDDGRAVAVENRSLTLAPEENTRVRFGYETTTEDPPEVTLQVASANKTVSAVVVVESGLPSVQVQPQTLVFPTLPAGEQRVESVVVENRGTGAVDLPTLRVTGPGAEAFSVDTDGLTLGPDEEADVDVTFAPPGGGEFAATLEVVGRAGVERDTSDLSGTGVGGDGQQDNETRVRTATQAQDGVVEVRAVVENATAGDPVEIGLPAPDEDREFVTENVTFVPAVDTGARVNITSSSGPLPGAPTGPFPNNGTTRLGNISVASTLAPADVEEVAFVFSLDETALDRFQSTAEDVALYRFNETQGAWVQKETEALGRSDGRVVFRGVGEQFSDWTVAVQRPEFNITETAIEVGTATTDEEVVIQVFVTNTGGTDGTYEADLLTNREVVDTKEATVPEDGTVLVTFLRTFAQPGLYRIQVNDVPVGDVDISADENVTVTTPAPGEDTTTATETETPTEESNGAFGPGFGVLGAVAGLFAFAYLLGRRGD